MEDAAAFLDISCAGLLPLLPAVENEPALCDDICNVWFTRAELRRHSLHLAKNLMSPRKRLVFLSGENRAATVIAFLAAAAAGHAVLLYDPDLPQAKLADLIHSYRPEIQLAAGDLPIAAEEPDVFTGMDQASSIRWAVRKGGQEDSVPVAPQLALLLATSGTTGRSRFVRLSGEAVVVNARQIAEVLDIDGQSSAIAHLPLHYSYGISVVTSHLQVGGRVFVMADAITSASFWDKVAQAEGTHFPGVPFHYTVLARLGFETVPLSVRTFTQAGGALDLRIQSLALQKIRQRGGEFHVMYGQTEASPRITTTPRGVLSEKLGSVGVAMPGGRIRVLDEGGMELPPGKVGRVVYDGANVMMGYALNRGDLNKGEEIGRSLDTGDLGWLDADDYLFLKGRTKRFAKISGLRIGLDEVEADIVPIAPVSCFDHAEKIVVCHESGGAAELKARLKQLANEYRIPPTSMILRYVQKIPRKASGKTDYARLRDMVDV